MLLIDDEADHASINTNKSGEDAQETVFTEYICDFLVEQAVIENYVYIGYKKVAKGLRVDAWNLNDDTDTLNLFITDFRVESDLQTLSQTEVTKNFNRVENFFLQCQKKSFINSLEESTPGYELAREIFNKSKEISRIQIYLLSNTEISSRIDQVNNNRIEGFEFSYDIWDLSRLYRIESSGKAREDVIIDFQEIVSGELPCLPAFTSSKNCESYLLVMPGNILSDLYEKYGERLLKQNVRTFLQFRRNVNKGIRNTLKNEPEMFFAYNNGLTATAENVELDERNRKIRN